MKSACVFANQRALLTAAASSALVISGARETGVIVVEGPNDVIALNAIGVPAVALEEWETTLHPALMDLL